MKLNNVSCMIQIWYECCRVLTLAPILPFIVITAPMIELPSTRAPIANLQLSPLAIMEDAEWNKSVTAHTQLLHCTMPNYSPTCQLLTAQPSAIQ
jgi:hypothetical protein